MHDFFAITIVICLAAISPGPDFATVVKNAIKSRILGVYTACGVVTSLAIHSIYCILGLAIIISQSLLIFNIIKYVGAAYLIYIGVNSLLEKPHPEYTHAQNNNQPTLSPFNAYLQGLLCNLLNPKAILFLLAFFTLIISPHATIMQRSSFAVELLMIHLIWFSWLACMISHPRMQSNLSKAQFYISKIMGVALIGFGLKIATMHMLK